VSAAVHGGPLGPGVAAGMALLINELAFRVWRGQLRCAGVGDGTPGAAAVRTPSRS
jgi:hypothetical protein